MATATALRKQTKPTVGYLIDSLQNIRAQKRELAVREKELNAEYDAVEKQLMDMMDAEGLAKSTGKTASASINTTQNFNFIKSVFKKKTIIHIIICKGYDHKFFLHKCFF